MKFKYKTKIFDTSQALSRLISLFTFSQKKPFSDTGISRGNMPEGGRSSIEINWNGTIEAINSYFGGINPYIPIEYLKYLTLLSIFNPDVSQAVRNVKTLANTGHNIVIQDKKRRVTAAVDRLNEKAYQWYKISAGVDGLFNHYFCQLAVSGAISRENIIRDDLKGVERVVLVPTFSIRFKYDEKEGRYKPFQQGGLIIGRDDLIPLNQYTYSYFADSTLENSPYAIPEMISVLSQIPMQREMLKNLNFGIKKIGLLGLNVITVKKLMRKPGQSEEAWRQDNQQYINQVAESISKNYNDGILVIPDDQALSHHSITTDSRGVSDIFQLNEEQIFSALDFDPSMAGRNYSSTETYAGVVHNRMIKKVSNFQRLVKRSHEETCRLDLQLVNLKVTNLSVRFNENKSLEPNIEALAKNYETNIILKKVKSGMIPPDLGAQEAGYDEWFDKELLKQLNEEGAETKEFSWNPRSQQYELKRQSFDLRRVKLGEDPEKAKKVDSEIRKWIAEYLREVLPYFSELKNDVIDEAVKYIDEKMKGGDVDIQEFKNHIQEYVSQHPVYSNIPDKDSWLREASEAVIIDAGKFFKEMDLTVFDGVKPDIEIRFGDADREAMKFLEKIDNWYFSKFIDNKDFGTEIKEFLTRFFEQNEAGYGQWSDAVEKEFRRLFGRAFGVDINTQLERIITSSVSRIRLYSHMEQLYEAGFEYAENVEVLDAVTCAVCRKMNGKRFPVGTVRSMIQEFVQEKDLDKALEWIKKTGINSEEDADLDMDKLLEQGRGFSPFHPKCRGYVKGVFDS